MKKRNLFIAFACMAIAACLIITACTKDSGFAVMKIYTPVYKSSAEVRASIKTSEPQAVISAGKMFLIGNYIFLNEVNKGIHIIDNSNPSAPVNKAFINIPGNLDINVKGNTLYADCYYDLLVLDISNMQNITCKTFLHNIFPERAWVLGEPTPEGQVVVDWTVRDTTTNISVMQGQGIWKNHEYYTRISMPNVWNDAGAQYTASSTSPKSSTGIAGSTSRMAIIKNHLFTLSASQLTSINITNLLAPQAEGNAYPGGSAQTIFALNNKLFIGGSNGFSIFNVDNASAPVEEGAFGHFCSDDPVIADNNTAYVTLHTGNSCEGDIDELDVLDISNIQQPQMIKTYNLTNPNGLAKDGNMLFICDGTSGLKIFNAVNPANITLLKTINVDNPYDVICYNKIAFVSAKGGLYQFNYSDINNVKQLSKIALR